jgi:hypothetical protein
MDNYTMIDSLDSDGNVVKVALKNPGAEEYNQSQMEYNKAFRRALDSGALLRQKLEDYMVEQNIWNEVKQKRSEELLEEINAKEKALKGGDIKLSEAKEIALSMRVLRAEFRELLSERNQLDQNSVEGQADNARFSELVRLCMHNPNTKKPYFPTQKDYDSAAAQPWVAEAASKLANIIYGLDPNYDNKLVENKFLKEFNFVNDDLRLVNNDGHLIDFEGRLIDDDGRYVAYRSKKAELEQDVDKRYFVNIDGQEVVARVDDDGDEEWVTKDMLERKPFLDDDGNPILSPSCEKSEDVEIVSSDDSEVKKPARKKRTTKAEKDVETS